MSAPSATLATRCRAADAALVAVDVQQRLGDAMPGKVLNRVLQNARLLVSSAALLGVPVIATEQYPQGLGATHPELAAVLPAGAPRIPKRAFSCCDEAAFTDALAASARAQVVLLGMEAHVCVLQTALDLLGQQREVFVVEDAICSRRLENYQNALDRLRQAGVAVVSAESVVFEWLGTSSHEHFRTIQAMLR